MLVGDLKEQLTRFDDDTEVYLYDREYECYSLLDTIEKVTITDDKRTAVVLCDNGEATLTRNLFE